MYVESRYILHLDPKFCFLSVDITLGSCRQVGLNKTSSRSLMIENSLLKWKQLISWICTNVSSPCLQNKLIWVLPDITWDNLTGFGRNPHFPTLELWPIINSLVYNKRSVFGTLPKNIILKRLCRENDSLLYALTNHLQLRLREECDGSKVFRNEDDRFSILSRGYLY